MSPFFTMFDPEVSLWVSMKGCNPPPLSLIGTTILSRASFASLTELKSPWRIGFLTRRRGENWLTNQSEGELWNWRKPKKAETSTEIWRTSHHCRLVGSKDFWPWCFGWSEDCRIRTWKNMLQQVWEEVINHVRESDDNKGDTDGI